MAAFSVKVCTAVTASAFKPIEKWEDVIPFAGRIVAVVSKSLYIGKSDADKPLFGRVAKTPSLWIGRVAGYNLSQFKVPGQIASNCALIDKELMGSSTSIRLASQEELEFLKKQVEEGALRLEYDLENQALVMIDEELANRSSSSR